MGLRIFSPLMPLIIRGSINQGFVSPDYPSSPTLLPEGEGSQIRFPSPSGRGVRGEGLKIGAFT
jgi:hypothetical protein